MKKIKSNLKLIIAFIIGVLLTSGIAYAAVSAREINYTREGTNIQNVEEALNELYSNTNIELKTLTAYSVPNVLVTSSTVTIEKAQTAKFVCSIRTGANNSNCKCYVNGTAVVNDTAQTAGNKTTMDEYDVELNVGDEVYIEAYGCNYNGIHLSAEAALIYIK